jgi:hypothetical protein
MDEFQKQVLKGLAKMAVALERIADALEPLAKMIQEELEEEERRG